METCCKHFAHVRGLVLALLAITASLLLLFPPHGRPQAPQVGQVGIDPKLLAAANAGEVDSQLRVASAYAKGNGVSQDYNQAASWLKKAADEGWTRADYILGIYYHRGLGVPQDDSQAVLWYRKAADHGDADAEYALGLHYENGEGVQVNFAQAADWYRKAAEQDNGQAQFHLGQFYENGQGVPRDEGVAAGWFGEAANHGNAYAQTRLEWLKKNQESRLELRSRAVTAAIWICGALFLFLLLWRFRAALILVGSRLRPRTVRAKQLSILLLVASWCSVCCVYQFFDMWHPIEAVVKTLLLCTPAAVFGAVGFWWLSQTSSNGKAVRANEATLTSSQTRS